MVGGASVSVPVGVDAVVVGGSVDIPLIRNLVLVKAVPAVDGTMAVLEAHLTFAVVARLLSSTGVVVVAAT